MEPNVEGPQLEWVFPDGRMEKVQIRLSLPVPDNPEATVFVCRMQMACHHNDHYDVFGSDGLQAVCLAIQCAFRLLREEVALNGGEVCYPDGNTFPFEAYIQ